MSIKPRKYDPNWCMPIGNSLKDCMDAKGITSIKGVHPDVLKDVMAGELGLTEPIAKKIEGATGVKSSFWINIDNDYQEGKARGLKECVFPDV